MKKNILLETAILNDLIRQKYKPDDAIPSRNQLGMKYKCSRTTVETAIRRLKQRGILASSQGAPTRVLNITPPRSGSITDLWIVAPGLDVYSPSRLRAMFLPGLENKVAIHTVESDEILKRIDNLVLSGTALLWIMPAISNIYLIRFFEQKNIPQLLINRNYEYHSFAMTDTEESIREGISWLMIEAGKEIALVTKRPNLSQPYLSERLAAFYETCISLHAELSLKSLHIRPFTDIPREMSEVGLQLFGSDNPACGIVVLDSKLTLPLVTCGQVYGKCPGRDYYLLTYDTVPELNNYPGVAMMRQQDEKLFLETKRWLMEGFAVQNISFQSKIKTELIRPPQK